MSEAQANNASKNHDPSVGGPPVLRDAFGHMSRGLDRGAMGVYTTITAEAGAQPNNQDSLDDGTESYAETDSRVSAVGDKLGRFSARLRSKLHRKENRTPSLSRDQGSLQSTTLSSILAPAPPKTSKQDRFSEVLPEKPKLPPLEDFVKSPLQTAITVAQTHGGDDAAQNLAKTAATHEASVKIVRAYDKIAETETSVDEELARRDLELLKKSRQDAFVRWTLDRHIHKVGSVNARSPPPKLRKDFLVADEDGQQAMQWEKYGKHLLLHHLEQHGGQYIDAASVPPRPSRSALMAAAERFLLSSAPFQQLFIRLRRVAHWKNPPESAAYMVLYLVLLYHDLIMSALLLVTFALVLMRRSYPPTVQDLRETLERSEDREATATDLSEFIEQHGGQGWVDALVEKAGPAMQLQVEDWADLLEMLLNFYEWRDSTRTAFSLGIIALAWLMVTFIPLRLLVKGFFLGIGVHFFGLMPLSYRFPRYRRFTSPFIWLFWKVPTHAEWAIARLPAEAGHNLAALGIPENQPAAGERAEDTTSSSPAGSSTRYDHIMTEKGDVPRSLPVSLGRYRCTSQKYLGNLCLSTEGVSFETTLSATQKWTVRYKDIQSIEKLDGNDNTRPGSGLLFTDVNAQTYQVSGLKDRDIVFSQIIGYSRVRWKRTG